MVWFEGTFKMIFQPFTDQGHFPVDQIVPIQPGPSTTAAQWLFSFSLVGSSSEIPHGEKEAQCNL